MSEIFLSRVKKILNAHGLDTHRFVATPCREGGNNLVYEIDLGYRKVLAKLYFRSSVDRRNRLEAEGVFIDFVGHFAPRKVPDIIAIDHKFGIGIYEFIEGQKVQKGTLLKRHIEAAAQFLIAINSAPGRAMAGNLPNASEACFSLADHIEIVDSRIARLKAIKPSDELNVECIELVNEVSWVWQGVRERMMKDAISHSFKLNTELPLAQRCLSPSDFGFHNALLKSDGDFCFIDFEYAGWDDPAKMVADFFCQPQVPVPDIHFDTFLSKVMSVFDRPEELEARTRIVWPAQKIKWICIMLNVFLRDAAKRRLFANPESVSDMQRKAQIDKARMALQAVKD